MAQKSDGATKNIVLIHGGFVDGSGWEDVYQILERDGYNVSVVENPTISLTGDVAATRAVLDTQDGPAVLVGHSYGGVVIPKPATMQRRHSRLHYGFRSRRRGIGWDTDRKSGALVLPPRSRRSTMPRAFACANCRSRSRICFAIPNGARLCPDQILNRK
jgi:hypothetical protein